MATELGAAYLSILPDLSKLGGAVTKGMSAAGTLAAKAFTNSTKKEVGGLAKAFGEAGKDAGEALAKQALAAAKSDISKLSKQMATATDAQANALGRLRVAQAKLTEVQGQAKPKASQLAAAEEAVAAAQRKANVATDSAKSITERLTAAQAKAKEAAEDVAKAQKDAAAQSAKAGGGAGSRFTQAFKSGFRPQDAASQLNNIDGKREGKALAARFGVGFNGAFGGIVSKSAALLAATFATVGLTGLATDAVTLEADFSQTMNTMAAVAKVPAAEIKNLSDLALKMGADTTFSAGEAGGAMLELAKGGLSAATIQGGALEGTLTLAAAGGTSLETAATIASNALNTFSLKGKDMASVAAALAGGANASSASVESLGEALSQVGPGATTAGLTLQDTVGVLSSFDAAGIKGSDAGTSLKTMLTRLVPSTNQAKAAMKDLGLKFTDANGAFVPITDVAEQLRQKLGKLSAEQQTTALSTIFGSDATRAATVLMKEGSAGISRYIAATKDQNAANEVAAARMAGTAGAIEGFKGSVETAKLQLGQFLAPTVQKGLKTLTAGVNNLVPAAQGLVALLGKGDFTSAFRQAFNVEEDSEVVSFLLNVRESAITIANVFTGTLLPAGQAVFGFFADNKGLVLGLVAAYTSLVVVTKLHTAAMTVQAAGGFASFLGQWVAQTRIAAGVTKAWAATQWLLNIALSANPIGLIVIGVGLAIAAIVILWKKNEGFRNALITAWEAIKTAAGAVWGAIKTAIGAVGTAFGAVRTAVGTAIGAIVTAFNAVKNAVSTAVGFVRSTWSTVVGALAGPAAAVVNVLQAIWSRVYPIIALPFFVAKKLITDFWTGVQTVFTAASTWVTGVFAAAWSAVSSTLAGPINTAKAWIATAWAAIIAGFTAAKDWTVGAFAKAWSAVRAVVLWPVNQAKEGIRVAWGLIRDGFTSIKDWAVGTFSKAWAALEKKLTGPIDAARNALGTILGGAKGGLKWVFEQAVKGIGTIWDGLQELAKKPIRFIVNTVLNDGLIDSFNWVASKFQAPTIPRFNLPKGFATGGELNGPLPGKPSAVDNMLGWFKGKAVGLASGEFITNAKDTARALPLLRHINSGGELPALGFADGGLFGSLKSGITGAFNAGKNFGQDVLGFMADPVKWFKDRLAGPLGRMSELGNSPFAQVAKAVPSRLVDTVSAKAKDLLTGVGGKFNPGLAGALSWARSQVGKPYIWGGVGPEGYDCSGFMSAIVNAIRGTNLFQRLFATGSLPAGMFAPGPGAFEIGWFTGNPGHVAGTLNGVNVESRGGRGVVVGPAARGAHDGLFNRHGHLIGYAGGGIVGDPPFDELDPRGKSYRGKAILPRSALSFDSGGLLPTGYSVAYNGTGQPEPVGHDVLRRSDLDGLKIVLEVDGVGKLNAHIESRAARVRTRTDAALVHEHMIR